MEYRELGNTGLRVSAVSFGTWAIGGSWGTVDDETSLTALAKAIDAGVNFFDTADVYGSGRAEQLLARATKGRSQDIYIATKFCRSGDITNPDTYTEASVRAFCEASLRRLERETIDLYQIHCPPDWVIQQGTVFEVLDKLQREGKIRYYGVSVETVEEGLTAISYPGVKALQVIFNLFRQKPVLELFPEAQARGVGILARLPLASGLLTGKFTGHETFEQDDHRNFNRDGESFNVGETFAGLAFQRGVTLADQIRWIADGRVNMTRASMKWILEHPAVSCVIPGFKSVPQVEDNLETLNVASFTEDELNRLHRWYQTEVAPFIRGPY